MVRRLSLIPRADRMYSLLPDLNVFDSFFNNNWMSDVDSEDKSFVPVFDISESDKEYVIKGEIPGIDSKDLEITLLDKILTIKGEKKCEEKDEDENYHRIERRYGSFMRSFRLPDDIQADKLDAKYKDGVLKLILPKGEAKKATKIQVN